MCYQCRECGYTFEEPKKYVETHNLNFPPYETWLGCPKCMGNYIEIKICNCCNQYIVTDKIYKIKHDFYCENCVLIKELGDV